MKPLYCFLAILWPAITTHAQKPLKIGDTIPDIPIQNIVNHKTTPTKLSDFKNKLIILDFWATWCGSCISSFPKMHRLQQAFNSNLQFLLVNSTNTKDDITTVNRFFQKPGNNYALPSLVQDTVFNLLFPHKLLPHYVWINPQRVVVAITSSDAITEENIATIIKGTPIHIPVKNDQNYKASLPLLEANNGGVADDILYRSTITRYLPGLGGGTRIFAGSTYKKICFLNYPLLALYQYALEFPINRVIIELTNKQIALPGKDKANVYSYEITFPAGDSIKKIKSLIAGDLNRYLSLNGRLERRIVDCQVVQNLANTKSGNHSLDKIINDWEILGPPDINKPILVNESTSTENIKLPANAFQSIELLKKALQPYGLQIVSARRELTMFVLSN